MKQRHLAFLCCVLFVVSGLLSAGEDLPILKVGHVGHDHHIALFIACDLGPELKKESGGVWLETLKPHQVYRLHNANGPAAQVMLLKVRGGAGMPSSLAAGEIDVGLGGLAPSVAAIDKGAKIKIVAPLNTDGDMLMVSPKFPASNWEEFVAAVKASERPVKIGYKAPNAVAYLIFQHALDEVDLRHGSKPVAEDGTLNHILLINLKGGKNMVPSLASGAVDGFVMNQPMVAIAEERKLGKVLADLRDLPPTPIWENHPCCAVLATNQSVKNKKPAVIALLQAILAGGRLARNGGEEIIAITSNWTKNPESIERRSIPTVTYVTHFTKDWNQGVITWLNVMKESGHFDGLLKDLSPDDTVKHISSIELLSEASKRLPPVEEQDKTDKPE